MIIDRIIEIQEEVEPKSARSFELSIGKTSGYLNMAKKNNSTPSADVVAKIIETYPEYNLYWIITGEGEKLKRFDESNTVNEVSATYLKDKERDFLTHLDNYIKNIVDKAMKPEVESLNKDLLVLFRRVLDIEKGNSLKAEDAQSG